MRYQEITEAAGLTERRDYTVRVVPDDTTELAPGSAAEYKRRKNEIVVRDRWKNNRFLMSHEVGHALLDGLQPGHWDYHFREDPKAWDEFLDTATCRTYQKRDEIAPEDLNNPWCYDWVEVGADLYMEYEAGRFSDKPRLTRILMLLIEEADHIVE